MHLEYQLERSEIEESLLCLDYKREGKAKYWNVTIMSVIAAICLIVYAKDPSKLFLLFLAGVCILFMFILVYLPGILRKQKSARMGQKNGIYKIKVPESGIKKAFESERVFTILAQEETYCIPKRILKKEQEEEIRRIITEHAEKVFKITTGR